MQENFKSVPEVLAYLQTELGRKVKQSKLYQDRSAGLLRVDADGSYSLTSVKKYALTLPVITAVSPKLASQAETLSLRRAQAEAEKAEEYTKLMVRKREILEGKYIPREQLELLLAGRAVMLDEGLRAMVVRDAAELIEAAGGNPQNSKSFCDKFDEKISQLLTDYTRLEEIEVEFEPDSSDFDSADFNEEENADDN